MKLLSSLAGLTLALTVGLSAFAAQETEAKAQEASAVQSEAAMIAEQIPTYPFTTCLVSEESLTEMGEPKDILHEGRLVRLCCGSCVKAFQKDPAAILAQIDQAIIAQQTPDFPLEACPISGEKLGSMGEPVNVIHGTRLVRLCCEGCKKGFAKDPAATMAKLDAAYIAAQKPSYPLNTCVVSGEGLDAMGEPVDMLYGNTLVRLCCKGCVKKFKSDPTAFMAKLQEASPKKAMPAKAAEQAGGNG